MTPETVVSLVQQAIEVGIAVSAPMLLAALAVGLAVSVLQAATQVNEMTLSFIPKLGSVLLAVVIAGPWMLELSVGFLRRVIESIPVVIG